jgi:hypothetical protein
MATSFTVLQKCQPLFEATMEANKLCTSCMHITACHRTCGCVLEGVAKRCCGCGSIHKVTSWVDLRMNFHIAHCVSVQSC